MLAISAEKGRIEAHGYGKLTLSDLQALEKSSSQNIDRLSGTDLVLDLRLAEGASIDALLEEWRFVHRHAGDFRRIAIISDDKLFDFSGFFSRIFFTAEIRSFNVEDVARAWIDQEDVNK